MAQKQTSRRRQQSDFPVFEYLDKMAPNRLIAKWTAMPRPYRWTIISILASSVLLWVFLKVVIGGLNSYIDSQIPRGLDAMYLPYDLESRALPVLPETLYDDAAFVVLPGMVEQYTLQIPPSEEEQKAAAAVELEAFLSLSLPAEDALAALQESFAQQLQAQASTVETAASASVEADAAPGAEQVIPFTVTADLSVETAAPTTIPVELQATAVNIALAKLSALNATLADSESIEPVFPALQNLREAVAGLEPSGIMLPEVNALNVRLTELAEREPPANYAMNDCLMSSRAAVRRDEDTPQPCAIDRTATFVEQGEYRYKDMPFNVVAAQYPSHEMTTQAIRQIFNYARTVGYTGNFSFGPIAYDYVFSQVDGLQTLTWSHENWVYSVTGEDFNLMENFVTAFPY